MEATSPFSLLGGVELVLTEKTAVVNAPANTPWWFMSDIVLHSCISRALKTSFRAGRKLTPTGMAVSRVRVRFP